MIGCYWIRKDKSEDINGYDVRYAWIHIRICLDINGNKGYNSRMLMDKKSYKKPDIHGYRIG